MIIPDDPPEEPKASAGNTGAPGHDDDVQMPHSHVNEFDISPPRGQPFPIVGIGASAGGLEALTDLLSALPEQPGMALVVVQHLDPHHESQLTDLLAAKSHMPVRTVKNGMRVQPDTVYVIPPNVTMVLEDGKLKLLDRRPGLHLPIDAFFESLARVQGSRAVGIVLSGNASDGSQGIRAIKGECGLTFAQDEGSARHGGMPRSAIATGAVDFVLSPAGIARELMRVSQHPYVAPPHSGRAEDEHLPEGDGELARLFSMLQSVTKVDFSHYKQSTVRRRIGRRMIVQHAATLADYYRYLEKHPMEVRELYRDLLIGVTNFFRDPGAYQALTGLLSNIPRIREAEEPLRFWAAGCATGEEVYSLAICAHELSEALRLSRPLQIFGTDIDEAALEFARAGIYQNAIGADVDEERLQRFFMRVDGGYQVSKAIRESCVFARQDITKDPPFAHTDVISCRNVLIYMDAVLQRRIFPVFHYSLNPTGLLVLGGAESIGASMDLFTIVDKPHSIFGRRAVPTRLTLDLAVTRSHSGLVDFGRTRDNLSVVELQKKVDRIIQSKYSPAAVLVDSDLQILQFRGHTNPYLDPSPGEASLHLLRMAREHLVVPLRRVIEGARTQGVSIRESNIVIDDGERQSLALEVTPMAGVSPEERYFLVVFDPVSPSPFPRAPLLLLPATESTPEAGALENEVLDLRRQLAETREYLRNLNEDHEAGAEELRAANEEVRSANEELQSTNEELSTAKEELQSANEELITVNQELQNRNQELDAVNNDLSNLLAAVSVPILMVDSGLRVRRFNAAAEKLLDLSAVDMGRPVAHLHGRIAVPGLDKLVQNVLDTLGIEQRETQDDMGRWYSLTVRPYRTADNHISGAVLVFIDIDPLKRSLKTAEEARDYAERMIETVRQPLLVLDGDMRVQRGTASFFETFQVTREETDGRLLYDLGNGQWNLPRLRDLLGNAMYRDQPFQDFEIEHDFPHVGKRTVRLNARRIPRPGDGDRRTLLLSIEDITERREAAEIRYRRLFETAKDGVLVLDRETGVITDVNPSFLELSGYFREEFIGRRFDEVPLFMSAGIDSRLLGEIGKEAPRYEAVPLVTRGGARIEVEFVGNRHTVGGQQALQIAVRDVTSRRRAERGLRESEERFRLFVESVRDYALFQMDLDGRITTWNPGAERMLGYTGPQIIGLPGALLFTPEDLATGEPDREIEKGRAEGRAEDERWHVRQDGSRFFASGVLTAMRDDSGLLRGFAKIMRDVTERRHLEERQQASIQEKETLLKEVHHRVKNNLQVMASLLGLQSHYISDPQTIALMDEMHNRVRSIAAIHEMLYSSPDFARIDFGAYLAKMARDLLAFYSSVSGRVTLRTELQSTALDISQAVPCGLIANELLTNSMKHGFPADRRGAVRIAFGCSGEACKLEVADDGIGLPQGLDVRQSTSMGLQLINLLVEQLQGTLVVENSNGTRFSVTFPRKND